MTIWCLMYSSLIKYILVCPQCIKLSFWRKTQLLTLIHSFCLCRGSRWRPRPEAGAGRGSEEYQQPREYSYQAGKEDRRQNCEILNCFINLQVLYIQKLAGLFWSTGHFEYFGVLLSLDKNIYLQKCLSCAKNLCRTVVCRTSVYVYYFTRKRKHPIRCQNALTKSSRL